MSPEKITLGEIKELIKEEKVSPSDLFGVEDLIGDPLVKGFVNEATKETQGKLRGEAEQRRRGEEGLDKKAEEWKKEKEEKDKKIKDLEIKNAKRDATDLFITKIKERKLDKPQEAFLKSKQDNFEPEDLENLEKEVDKFMDKNVEEYNITAKIFGQKVEGKKDEPKGGSEPGEGGETEEDELIPD